MREAEPARRGRRLDLRARVAIRITAIVLALAVGVGLLTYLAVRRTLLGQRQDAAVEQVVANGRLVATTLVTGTFDSAELLAALRPPQRSRPLLYHQGDWFTASLQIEPDDLPAPMRRSVIDGAALRQRSVVDGELVLVVGAPLPSTGSAYFEVFSLQDLSSTLTALRQALIATGAAATALGAVLGWWAAGRAVRPLARIGAVAERIAGGALDSRLDEEADRDLAQFTASFNRMAQALQERIQYEARFASDVSHELRSPLTTIATSLAVLQHRRDDLSADGRTALDHLSTDFDRFQRTVADLIEISKYDAGVVGRADMTEVRLGDYVQSVLRRTGHATVAVTISKVAADALVCVDQRRLERAVRNLLANAETHGGGPTGVRVTLVGDEVRIAVEDAGPGIPDADRQRIFERFARGTGSHRSGRRDGSGLGLALAAEDVRLHGGRLWVEDNPGGGSRFVIALPWETTP